MSPVIESLRKMGLSLDGELRSLLAFFGESPESPDAPKPEDFFGLILSFSSALQKAALEVHDAMSKSEPASPKIMVEETAASPTAEEGVCMLSLLYCAILTWSQTVKGKDKDGDTLRPQSHMQLQLCFSQANAPILTEHLEPEPAQTRSFLVLLS